jgi:hypothetical protein
MNCIVMKISRNSGFFQTAVHRIVISMAVLCGVILFPGHVWSDDVNNLSRDAVGDLNAPSVKAGDFPGAIQLPGDGISLAIGGFVVTAAIVDSHAEKMGADFVPATPGSSDNNGSFSIDSTLARLYFDARAPVPHGKVRGYIEYDMNASNNGSLGVKLRHAYGKREIKDGSEPDNHRIAFGIQVF